jgi:hypothetical protein
MNYAYLLELAVLIWLYDEEIMTQEQYFKAIEHLKAKHNFDSGIKEFHL